MSDRLTWFPFWVRDFLTSRTVALMSMEEVGVYVLLLCHQWEGGTLPDDPGRLAKLIRADANIVQTVFERCFVRVPNGWENERLEAVREEQLERYEKYARAGRASAKSRRRNKKERRSSDAAASLEHTDTDTEEERDIKLQPSLPPVTQPSTGDVENSSDSAEDEKQEPDGGDYSVRITDSKLRQEALSGMGAGKFTSALDQRRVDREVQDMIHTIDRENLLAAMRGFARLRDKGEVGLQPGKAYTPRVLLAWGKKGVWWGEGDQRTQRNFLDLCQEVGRMEQEPKTQRRGGMDSMADVLAQLTTPGEA